MNALQLFEYENREIRVVQGEDGEPWFVAADVAEVLGYTNPWKAVGDHCKAAERMTLTDREGQKGGAQFLTIIPERDVYRLIMRSKLPKAQEFEEWVVGTVLPSIRKHGAYATPVTIDRILEDPDYGIQLLQTLKFERQQRQLAESQRDEAVRTKALIGSRREATSMATASAATRRAEALAQRIGDSKTWKQVKGIPWVEEILAPSKGMWSVLGKKLRAISEELGFEVRRVPDSTYGEVCAFHAEAIEALHLRLLADPAMLGKYRKDDSNVIPLKSRASA